MWRFGSRTIGRALVAGAVAACAVLAPTGASAATSHLIVGFAPRTTAAQRVAALAHAGVAASAATAPSDTTAQLARLAAQTVVVSSSREARVEQALRAQPGVTYVEADALVSAAATNTPTQVNDPDIGKQWGLSQIQAPAAWATSDGTGVTIAIVDTGVDMTHPDLAGKVVPGWDFVDNDADPTDESGHGTHVAGIAAAIANNAQGGSGVAPGAQILPVRVLDAQGQGTYANIASGVTYAADHGAKVINLSLSDAAKSDTLDRAIEYATSHGAVVTCATGNGGLSSVSYPAAYSGCLSVGAITQADRRAKFSDYGKDLDLVAPGQDIVSTMLGGSYESLSGTSMAAPFVAGVAALLASEGLNRAQIIATLESTADDLGPAGRDPQYGYGLVDASKAVAAGAALMANAPPPDTTPPTIASLGLATGTFAAVHSTRTVWKLVTTTAWQPYGHSGFGGHYAWSTSRQHGAKRTVTQYHTHAGEVSRRVLTYKASHRTSTQRVDTRSVVVAASDNVSIDHVAVAVDGHFLGVDWNGSDGWSVLWVCSPGKHTFSVTVYDGAENPTTAAVRQTVAC